MPAGNMYRSGEYWDKNPSFHEEDAEFKVTNAVTMLKRNTIAPRTILDVGTGSGKHAYLLATHYDVPTIGLDVSARTIEHARQHYVHPTLEYRAIDVTEYPDTAHVGFMFDVFEHVEDYLGFLRSALHKSDYWLFNVPLDMNVLCVLRKRYMVDRAQVGHLHYFSRASAIATLEHCGYEILDAAFASVVMHQLKTHFSLKGLIAALPRLILFKLNQSFAVTLLGGSSLMVLCRPRQE